MVRTPLIQVGPLQWFPDSKSILVGAYCGEKERIVDHYRMNLDNGETELVRQGDSRYFWPDLSADGESMFLTEIQQGNSVFKRFEIKSSQEEVILRIPPGKHVRAFVLSPDGKETAWVERDNDTGTSSIYTKPVKGGAAEEHLKIEAPAWVGEYSSVLWMSDGRHLLVSKMTGEGDQSELLRISLDSVQISALGTNMELIRFGDVHKDGRLVTFWSGRRKDEVREIWSLSGFLATEVAAN